MLNAASNAARAVDEHAVAAAPGWRWCIAALFAISRLSLPLILVLVLLSTDPPITPPVLVRVVLLLAVLPGAAAWMMQRAFAARLEVDSTRLTVHRRGTRVEVPGAAIARIRPWRLPVPSAGFSLQMKSGRRLPFTIQTRDPLPLIDALAGIGAAPAAQAAAADPSVIYADAKAAAAPRRWFHVVGRYPLFALAPGAVLFNAHQFIAYGGTFGEYYLLGALSYARTFVVYWLTVTIYLVLYASVWRGAAEAGCLFTAWLAPAYAARARRIAETVCQVSYYGGVPALLALRFM
jgi:hypothetical protein